MADVFTKRKRSLVMAAIRSKSNKATEIKLLTIFKINRITGWRRNQSLPGKPDFTFRAERVVVFVDGCFWHACPKHGRKPDTNTGYWIPKLLRNRERDRSVNRQLREFGWTVLRFWEHELRHSAKVANRVATTLQKSKARKQTNSLIRNPKTL